MTRRIWLAAALVILATPLVDQAAAQADENTRTVKGLVTDEAERPIRGAVVQLKNTKTLQVKSFFTTPDGKYYFHNLDPNVDYEIKAKYKDTESRTRTVSSFDDRDELIYNFELKLEQ